MSRLLFCHESELLHRFSACEFVEPILWENEVAKDAFWGEPEQRQRRTRVNVNFLSQFSDTPLPPRRIIKVCQIHPGFLLPAIFIVVDEASLEVYSLELLHGDMVRLKNYPQSISMIKVVTADSFSETRTFKMFTWWRVWAMFDRILFFAAKGDLSAVSSADRTRVPIPATHRGECFLLRDAEGPVGIDGWLEYPTGFGADAPV